MKTLKQVFEEASMSPLDQDGESTSSRSKLVIPTQDAQAMGANKNIDMGPALSPSQVMGDWDPNKPTGQFQKTLKSLGGNQAPGAMQKAMLAMPDQELKRYFGLSKQSLKGKTDFGKASSVGMKPYNPIAIKGTKNDRLGQKK